MNTRALMACLAGSLALLACSDEDLGKQTDTACPTGSTVTYPNDIEPFMTKYCVTCHAKSVPVSSRNGAPTDHNFETESGVLAEATHVDQEAGASASVTNTEMPPKGFPAPSVEERKKLSEWLACNQIAGGGTPHTHE
jgi:uncharacterized membrane protein